MAAKSRPAQKSDAIPPAKLAHIHPPLRQFALRLDTLNLDPENAQEHSPDQINAIAQSLKTFGQDQLLVVQKQGRIIRKGNGRTLGARQAGYEYLAGIIVDESEVMATARALADNRTSALATSNEKRVGELLQKIRASGEAIDPTATGYNESAIALLLSKARAAAQGVDPDEPPPEPPKNPITKPGDVWLLGRHRLICGDCRDQATVDRVIGQRSVNMVITSPPYAEQRDYDETSGFVPIPPDQYVDWFEAVVANVRSHMANDGSFFLNIKPASKELDTDLYVFDLVLAFVRKWGWHFATEFCWRRNGVPKQVTRRFKNQFEPVYQFTIGDWKIRPKNVMHESDNVPVPLGKGAGPTTWKDQQGKGEFMASTIKKRKGELQPPGAAANMQGEFDPFAGRDVVAAMAYPGNLLPTFASTHEATGHSAAFPVGLPQFFVKAYTDQGDLVYEPFSGSGSTIMACEIEGRDCAAVELSPAYCDIQVARWERYTGQKAERESKKGAGGARGKR